MAFDVICKCLMFIQKLTGASLVKHVTFENKKQIERTETNQVAQLSQTNRAAAWAIFGKKGL